MDISLRRETKIVMGQRMYESMSFLQMSAEEVDESMKELCLENPMVEEIPPKEEKNYNFRTYGLKTRRHNGEDTEIPVPDRRKNTLREDLNLQALSLDINSCVKDCLDYLIINLDDRGYLPNASELSEKYFASPETFRKARETLRGMEPAGVGAENIVDCLCIQLDRSLPNETIARTICMYYLEHLAKNHVNHIARALSIPESEVMRAKKVISSLNPVPSNGYDDGRETAYAIPEAEVTAEKGVISVISLEAYRPTYIINKDYADMSQREDITAEEREYFKEKLGQAQWAMNCIGRRRETLLRCVEAIAEEQAEYFEFGGSFMRRCSMNDIAAKLNIHPSTVSRAVRDKYISCRWGIFPISKFFDHDVNGDSQSEIKQAIRDVLAREDELCPMSDAEISDTLETAGYLISRRTVAKYRAEMDIPSATGRKLRR